MILVSRLGSARPDQRFQLHKGLGEREEREGRFEGGDVSHNPRLGFLPGLGLFTRPRTSLTGGDDVTGHFPPPLTARDVGREERDHVFFGQLSQSCHLM